MTDTVQDSLLAGSLITAPAWVPLLNTFNEFVTTVTLMIGLVIGLTRLWILIRRDIFDKQD